MNTRTNRANPFALLIPILALAIPALTAYAIEFGDEVTMDSLADREEFIELAKQHGMTVAHVESFVNIHAVIAEDGSTHLTVAGERGEVMGTVWMPLGAPEAITRAYHLRLSILIAKAIQQNAKVQDEEILARRKEALERGELEGGEVEERRRF